MAQHNIHGHCKRTRVLAYTYAPDNIHGACARTERVHVPSQVSGALMEGAFSSSDDCATHAHYDAAIRWSFGLNLLFFLLVAAQARNAT